MNSVYNARSPFFSRLCAPERGFCHLRALARVFSRLRGFAHTYRGFARAGAPGESAYLCYLKAERPEAYASLRQRARVRERLDEYRAYRALYKYC